MSKLLVPAVMLIALGAAPAFAAPKAPAAHPPASVQGKRADCVRQWKAEKTHIQTMKAFMAACTKA